MEDTQSWITVQTFSHRTEAEIAQGFLAAHAISARVFADDVAQLEPHLALSSGVQLQVSPADRDQASSLLV